MIFYSRLNEGEQYAVLAMKIEVYQAVKENFVNDYDFMLHFIKENNPKFKDDELLKELYAEKSKLARKIFKREQELK